MALSTDMMRGLDVASRWRTLTERQVANLVEMYETGRWRRYYGEEQFRLLMQESVAAVEAWRQLNDITHKVAPRARSADVDDTDGPVVPGAAPAGPRADEPSRALQSLQSFSADFTRRGDGV